MEKNYHSKNYTKNAFNNAKTLRKKEQTTESEKLLWYYLKNRKLDNFRFRRQVAIGNYIVDFLCPEKKLIIELDGGQHNDNAIIIKDNEKTKYFNSLGYKFLRFWNTEIDNNIEIVCEIILNEVKK